MFKKIASIVLAAMLIVSMTVIAASAVEAGDAVAADDVQAVGSDDVQAVGADDNTAVGADSSESTGAASKIYFDSNSAGWKNFGDIFLYLYDHANGEIIPWGSKKGKMKDEGNGKWSFDLSAKSEYLDALKSSTGCGCIFTADWGMQTCDLIIGEPCIGDTAVCTGKKVENNVDSNKKSDEVKWTNADASKYGVPKCITSIGNVIGDAYWPGETPYTMMVKFLDKDAGKAGIDNALKFNGKDAQTTIDETAAALGLGKDDVEKAIKETGRDDLGWKKDQSKAPAQSSGGGDTSGGDTSGGDTSGGNTSGGNTSGGDTSGGSGTTGSVTSGEESTIYFILGGVMLAAIGVLFLARRRRDY